MSYEYLFRPGTIGPLRLKNRAVMMPMATEMADRFGLPTDRQIRYYQERAKGDVALIIHEYTVNRGAFLPSSHETTCWLS